MEPNRRIRRSSILKRIDSTEAPNSPTLTRRISFHGKASVKEFTAGTDKATIWHESYEEEAACCSNEPLPGASSISVFQQTAHEPTAATAASTTADKHTASIRLEDDHMSLTCVEHGSAEPQPLVNPSHLAIGADDDDCDKENNDVLRFNRSLDQLNFDNETLFGDDPVAERPPSNRTTCQPEAMRVDDTMSITLRQPTSASAAVVFSVNHPNRTQLYSGSSAMDFTQIDAPTQQQQPSIQQHSGSDMDCSETDPAPAAPVRRRSSSGPAVSVRQEVLTRRLRQSVYGAVDMDKTTAPQPRPVRHELLSPIVGGSGTEMDISDRRSPLPSQQNQSLLSTRRQSLMELTQFSPSGNCSIVIDESLLMSRDLFSSTKITGAPDANWSDVHEDSGADAQPPATQPPNRTRMSVIQRHTTQVPEPKPERQPQQHSDEQRFNRTVNALDGERLDDISAGSMEFADSDSCVTNKLKPFAGRSASLAGTGSFEMTGDSNTNTTDDLCNLNAEQICKVAPKPTAGGPPPHSSPVETNLHFSRLNNLADLTMFDRTASDAGQLSIRRCSIGTPAQTEETLCRRCAGCQRAGSAEPVRPAQLAPLGPLTGVLDRRDLGGTGVAGDAAPRPLHVDYSGCEQLAKYADATEVFDSFRQRMQQMRSRYELERMQISSNVPSPGFLFLLNNKLDVEYDQKKLDMQRLLDERSRGAPFPMGRTIDHLLRNVFETESLSWHYKDVLYFRGQLHLWNKRIPSVMLRLLFDVPTNDVDDADLLFTEIRFQACPKSVRDMHPLMWIKHNELLAGLPYELTSLCPTSAHLMSFLRRMDEQHYQPAVQIARSIDRLAGANDAAVARESDGTCYIERQLFDMERMERTIMTIKLTTVSLTSLKHVFVRPAREILETASTSTFGVGMPCIERLLREPWSYLKHGNSAEC